MLTTYVDSNGLRSKIPSGDSHKTTSIYNIHGKRNPKIGKVYRVSRCGGGAMSKHASVSCCRDEEAGEESSWRWDCPTVSTPGESHLNHHSINGLIYSDSCRFLAPAADLLSRGPLMGGIYCPPSQRRAGRAEARRECQQAFYSLAVLQLMKVPVF